MIWEIETIYNYDEFQVVGCNDETRIIDTKASAKGGDNLGNVREILCKRTRWRSATCNSRTRHLSCLTSAFIKVWR